ncbi:M48 family metalloprotease [Balneolaceae bacterium YR4-1]|uniref:M48 family metalloprotease n=1 Tax=Halalkalibaculum roseum TaxID=2709311 RepID=A0A6M1SLC5_9BACT|nr:M48 family metalloprotease [Halalkalibaculum roseum]NGP76131.1 M48 family metalloprotease [Halalkalibaculum roseum]
MRRFLAKAALPLVIVSFIITACVVQQSAITGDRRAYGYSWEQEKQIGRDADQQIQQQYGIYDNDELERYVENIGQEMLSVSHMRREDTPEQYKNTEFYFRVLDSPVVNAFALPGGYVYVTRGLLSHLENEAQLAVVLGHEIGHVAARHASQRAFEQQIGQVALLGGAIAGEELLGIPGGSVLNLGSQAAQLLFLSYGRDDERESDRLGVEYAAMQSYQAAEGADFFVSLERMSRQSGQSIPDWQSTHPDPSERAKTIPQLAESWSQKGYDLRIEGTDQYMSKINDIVYGNNPREGFTRNGLFYHPELKFQFPYPQDWQVINQRSLVAVVNKEQDAVSIMKLDSKSADVQASVNEFLNQEGITTVSKSAATNNELQAYEAVASGQTEEGTQIKFYIYALKHDGTIYRFLNYSTLDKFSNYEPRFKQITSGFKPLRDQSILDIQPVRLQAVKTNRSGTFESFLPENFDGMPIEITANDLAILNQVDLDERIEAGTWIKLPRQ